MNQYPTLPTFQTYDFTVQDCQIIVEVDYENRQTQIKIHHLASTTQALSNSTTPFNQTKQRTSEEVKQEVFQALGDEYQLLEDYKNINTKVLIQHRPCNQTYRIYPSQLLQGHGRCSTCSSHGNSKKTEIFKQQLYDLVGDEYELLSEYRTSKEKVTFKHRPCGNEYLASPETFLKGYGRCKHCKFTQKVHTLYEGEYEVISKYQGVNSKIWVNHTPCQTEYEVNPKDFLYSKKQCKFCKNKTLSPKKKVEV